MEQPIPTEHMIDDLPSQDQAMETFRTMSKFPMRGSWVSKDGMKMTFRILDRKRTDEYLKVARLIIAAFNLPLEEELDVFQIGADFIVEATLILKYTGK